MRQTQVLMLLVGVSAAFAFISQGRFKRTSFPDLIEKGTRVLRAASGAVIREKGKMSMKRPASTDSVRAWAKST